MLPNHVYKKVLTTTQRYKWGSLSFVSSIFRFFLLFLYSFNSYFPFSPCSLHFVLLCLSLSFPSVCLPFLLSPFFLPSFSFSSFPFTLSVFIYLCLFSSLSVHLAAPQISLLCFFSSSLSLHLSDVLPRCCRSNA